MRGTNEKSRKNNKMRSFVSRLLWTGQLLFLCVTLSGCAVVHRYGAFEGHVVETETGEPIEGAVVLVSYYTVMYTPAGEVSSYLDTQETMTSISGEFTIPAQFLWTFRPLSVFDNYVEMVVFKPGFGCFPNNKNSFPRSGLFKSKENINIKIPTLKTKDERIESLYCSVPSGADIDDYLSFKKLINVERVLLGYKPFK